MKKEEKPGVGFHDSTGLVSAWLPFLRRKLNGFFLLINYCSRRLASPPRLPQCMRAYVYAISPQPVFPLTPEAFPTTYPYVQYVSANLHLK